MGWGNIQSFTINSFGTTPYKILLGIKWTDQVSNDRIYQITGQYRTKNSTKTIAIYGA